MSNDHISTSACGQEPLTPQAFLSALAGLYAERRSLQSAWAAEEPALQRIVPAVASEISFNYDLLAPIGVGGSGVIAKVCDRNLRALRAIKFARPIPGKEPTLTEILIKETDKLRDLVHPNLIRIFAQGTAEFDGTEVPYYIMDFIAGDNAEKYLRANPSESSLLAIIRGALSGIAYMHESQMVHLDIKPGNIFVSGEEDVRVADLGFAKRISSEPGETRTGGTEGYMHPDFVQWIVETESADRQIADVPRSKVSTAWDLFAFGKAIKTLIAVLDEEHQRALSPYTRRYLRLMACRLLDGHNDLDEHALGISPRTFSEIKYRSAREALTDFAKLAGSYNLDARVPELASFTEDIIQASRFGAVPFGPRVAAIVGDTALRQLGAFTQLGLLTLVYPTATHTRLEHTLGTFAVLCHYIRALYSDPVNPLFRQLMTEEDLKAGLLAGLLHDVGHYPLAHDLEEADHESFSHEARTQRLIAESPTLRAAITRAEETAASGWGVDPERVSAILAAKPEKAKGKLRDRILHSLIDGPIDADKLDYLTRDSTRLDIPFGLGIDYDRLLRTLTIVVSERRERTYAELGIHENGKIPAESVAFARYAMFGAVYWQHTYRAIKAMINRLAWEVLRHYAGGDLWQPSGRYRARIKRDLEAYLSERSAAGYQLSLEEPAPRKMASVAGEAECMMVEWLAQRGGSTGEFMARSLLDRAVFKRALVVSQARGSVVEWGLLGRVFDPRTSWRTKLYLNEQVLSCVRQALSRTRQPEVPLSGVTPDQRARFLAVASSVPLVLLDYPPEKPGSPTGLHYLREDDRLSAQTGEIQIGDAAESEVWLALREKSRPSIAKLRLYCHPDYAKMLVSYLTRAQLEDCVNDALEEVVESGLPLADISS